MRRKWKDMKFTKYSDYEGVTYADRQAILFRTFGEFHYKLRSSFFFRIIQGSESTYYFDAIFASVISLALAHFEQLHSYKLIANTYYNIFPSTDCEENWLISRKYSIKCSRSNKRVVSEPKRKLKMKDNCQIQAEPTPKTSLQNRSFFFLWYTTLLLYGMIEFDKKYCIIDKFIKKRMDGYMDIGR